MTRSFNWNATTDNIVTGKTGTGSGTATGDDDYTAEQAERDVTAHVKRQVGVVATVKVTLTEAS